MGVQCALCHSTVDNSFASGIGRRLDGWANRDLNIGTIISLAPNLRPYTDLLSVDEATLSLTREGRPDLEKEFAAARSAGVDVETYERVPGLSFDTGPCVRFAHQAQFHPLKYLSGLATAFVRNGGRVYTQTRALSIAGDDHLQIVETRQGEILARAVVVATNTPFNDRVVMHTTEQRHQARQDNSKPVFGEIETLLLQHLHTVLPQSAFGKALHYLHGQWPKLIRYVEHGAWPISNNPCENAIRPFVVGRKGWMFCDTVGGANASANLYSLIETCKANKVDVYRYLIALFKALPRAQTADDFEALLPWRLKPA